MNFNVFCDLHHNALYNSFQLMGDRLGFQVFRPIGLDWFPEFWGIAEPYGNDPATAKQFLEITNEDIPIVNGAPAINHVVNTISGSYTCEDKTNETFNYGITIEAFKDTKFDVIIATIPYHWEKYKRLRDLYQPNARLIAQFGNLGWTIPNDYPNILDSTGSYSCPDRNYIAYHQEFNEKIFYPDVNITPDLSIKSFCLDFADKTRLDSLRNYCSGYNWEIYSVTLCADYPPITGISSLAAKMRSSLLGLHLKSSDGYGHLVHNWAACGVPLLVDANYSTGIFADELLVDNKTCMKLTGDIISDMSKINIAASGEQNHIMRENTRLNYKNRVDFAFEADKLRTFFANLR